MRCFVSVFEYVFAQITLNVFHYTPVPRKDINFMEKPVWGQFLLVLCLRTLSLVYHRN